MPPETDAVTELSEQTKLTVTATLPLLELHGQEITARLYERLFAENPGLDEMFTNSPDGQDERLAQAVVAYVTNLDNLEVLEPVIDMIAAKHVAAGVESHHYGIVGRTLLVSMIDVLGPLDVDVVEAWDEAFSYLAGVFIEKERSLMTAGAA